MARPTLPLPLKFLAGCRLTVGASSWLLPCQASQIFALLPLPPQTTIILRLFGVREAMLGVLLIAARTKAERESVVLAGVMVDSIDVMASAVGWATGEQEFKVAGMVGVGATLLAGVGWLGWVA